MSALPLPAFDAMGVQLAALRSARFGAMKAANGVGNPAREIREAFASEDMRGTVPFVRYPTSTTVREESCSVEAALMEALGSVDSMGADLLRLLTGDLTAAKRIREAAAEYWVHEHADEVLMYRRGELDIEPEQFIPSEAC